ncbi:nuclear transport factor 2 family protein [Sphingomonas nostoxanthinifaciens]|uniref:nuclear transport factor 2 family protein n=1 Tax=Sphingomonas nostoxanthinifaciens TaxID=2872652 RepID=UPI001CC1F096|nr:nuclear transport factor 2 family protein [Sphingomonas nostoxanthinifaciens]UAK22829.1 nuclear transport factor 2 family protein [Sphingomonas nostoxanthinifaciens]
MILAALLLATQPAKLPPANALPPPDDGVAAVMAPIDGLFAGLAARDGAAILRQVAPDGGATVATERPDGTRTLRHMNWQDFAAGIKPGPERYEERLTDPAVEVDGDIALVWSPYVFTIDGKVQHCGTDHFDLVRANGRWMVQNVTWSSRTTDCDAVVPAPAVPR